MTGERLGQADWPAVQNAYVDGFVEAIHVLRQSPLPGAAVFAALLEQQVPDRDDPWSGEVPLPGGRRPLPVLSGDGFAGTARFGGSGASS